MREIIYVQAGRLANYTGTHFWNTQEIYVPYGDDDPESSEVEIAKSCSENLDAQERITLYPRALIFDTKVNFGTLATEANAEEDIEVSATWSGNLVEYRQEAISKSEYHAFLDEGGEEQDDEPTAAPSPPSPETIRYWSDFSRMYYHPRSLQKIGSTLIPDDSESVVSWQEGQEAFQSYDKENDVMDDSLRLLVEDCDNMGAVQIMSDTSTFGAFTAAFLEVFRDEYAKPLSFAFPLFTGPSLPADDGRTTKCLLSEAFFLRSLKEFSSMNVPVYDPCGSVCYPSDNIYHRSALLSSLVETSTLPFRLKQCSQDIVSIWGALSSHNNTPFAELSGVFPFTGPGDFDGRLHNFSSQRSARDFETSARYAHVNVSRGFSTTDISAYDEWISRTRPTQNACYIASVHSSGYPLPSSFPVPPGASKVPPKTKHAAATMKLYSSLTASSNTALTFEKYATFVDKLVRQPSASAVAAMDGITRDELLELASDLWTIRDGCADDPMEE